MQKSFSKIFSNLSKQYLRLGLCKKVINHGVFLMKGIEAGASTMVEIFEKEACYRSPLFQRQYVWGKPQISELWDDITQIVEGVESSRFLGAVVFDIKSAGRAFNADDIQIIDGQQRLSTIYFFIIQFGLLAAKHGLNDVAKDLFEKYVLIQKTKQRGEPKILPTLLDLRQLNNVLREIPENYSVKALFDHGDKSGRIKDANLEIAKLIEKSCLDENNNFSSELFEKHLIVLLEKLQVVTIYLGDDQDPHQVFDSLNAKGIKLESKDLIRNLVFQKTLEDPEATEMVYRSYWLPVEESMGDHFENYFFPFALSDTPSTTKSKMLTTLKTRWKDWNAKEIIKDIKRHSDIYLCFVGNDAQFTEVQQRHELSARTMDAIESLKGIKMPTSVFPFIFRLFSLMTSEKLKQDTFATYLELIESFLVRRAICGYEPTGLHALFKDIFNKIGDKGNHNSPALFLAIVAENKTIVFPDNEMFFEAICNKPLYSRKISKYVIVEYENGFDGDPISHSQPMTIDHVMPQNSNNWEVDEYDHKHFSDTWGNLVPLSSPSNSKKSNRNWDETQIIYRDETIYRTPKTIANLKEWNIDTIKKRGADIATWACERWSCSV